MVWIRSTLSLISKQLLTISYYQQMNQCGRLFTYSFLQSQRYLSQNFVSVTKYNANYSRNWLGMLISSRNYAKGKDKKKDKNKKVTVNEEELNAVINVETMKHQMQSAIDNMKEDYIKNVSLRSTTGSLENLTVTYEGQENTLQELAQIIRKNPKTIVVNMTAFPQVIPNALEAIQKSGMNLNPQQDGTTLFIPIPKVTKEHREILAKSAKSIFVKCRDSIKDVQSKYNRTIKNKEKGGLSQDTSQASQNQVNSVGEQFVAQAQKIYQDKEAELLGKD